MARGWESKSVEQQQDLAEADKQADKPSINCEEAETVRKRQGLQLARSRVLQQMQAATHENHRRMLKAALAELDRQLAESD